MILTSDGKKKSTLCPKCGADLNKRVKTNGFGEPQYACGVCGHDFGGAKE